jgi:hypothetical protein
MLLHGRCYWVGGGGGGGRCMKLLNDVYWSPRE